MAGPPVSPWIWQASDYKGNVIRFTVAFNNATLALTSVTVFRDPACLYVHIYLGVGPDGTPDSSTRTFSVPAGTTVVPPSTLASFGFNTITDVQAVQITAGP